MKRYCCYHKLYYLEECDEKGDYYLGEKEPLSNTARTDGMCIRCQEKAEKEIDEYNNK